MILLNSYVIFKTIHEDRAFHVFKQKLTEEIIQKYIKKIKTPQKERKVTPCPSLLSRFTGQHFLIVIETTLSRKAQKRCVVYLSQKKRKKRNNLSVR
jgi:hypothetical protein